MWGRYEKTWKIINDTIKKNIKNSNIVIQDDERTLEMSEIPNKFNNYFSNIPQELVSNIQTVDD